MRACREFQFNRQRTMKEALEVWTLKEILDAAINYKRNSKPRIDCTNWLAKCFTAGREVLAMIDACQRV
jgi:hypothetical protein